MNLIEIRIVIYVPDQDKENFQSAIDTIVETVKWQFPGFKVSRMHSPVIVTIKELSNDGGEAIAPEDYP